MVGCYDDLKLALVPALTDGIRVLKYLKYAVDNLGYRKQWQPVENKQWENLLQFGLYRTMALFGAINNGKICCRQLSGVCCA